MLTEGKLWSSCPEGTCGDHSAFGFCNHPKRQPVVLLHYSHPVDEETEAQRGQVTRPKIHRITTKLGPSDFTCSALCHPIVLQAQSGFQLTKQFILHVSLWMLKKPQ